MPRLLKGWHGDPGRPTTAPTWQQMALPGGGTRDAHLRYDWLPMMASKTTQSALQAGGKTRARTMLLNDDACRNDPQLRQGPAPDLPSGMVFKAPLTLPGRCSAIWQMKAWSRWSGSAMPAIAGRLA